MAKRAGGIPRAIAMKMIPGAIKSGFSATGFLEYLKKQGLGYRRTIFLADWRSALGVSQVEGLLRFVRRDRLPTARIIADVEWATTQEYMFKVKVWSQTRPGEPLTERFVNIMSDRNMTPVEIEQQVFSQWGEWEKYAAESLKKVQTWSAYRRIPGKSFEAD